VGFSAPPRLDAIAADVAPALRLELGSCAFALRAHTLHVRFAELAPGSLHAFAHGLGRLLEDLEAALDEAPMYKVLEATPRAAAVGNASRPSTDLRH
jgi:hypothetical protein